ncbi:putative cytokinetic ring protein SteA [Nocardioides deserti]|uniref:Thiamine pyrophosphokinase n=1 Tax=Nocardioides deserti TaxID=1588644 RepID=A0ABR6UCH3_9ACTN|nr:putative cytokinetic ring protein SteA [Nocardioides deserti]MBC2962149.1 thiamine pyrophosphokinase [Nocardioides deserti]GGO67795.1 thiamin pyrophosphokinase [Nocardioides deserti]
MRLPTRPQTSVLPGVAGTARVERRARVLLPRLRPGDIAVLEHPALDRATAQRLVDAQVAAVVNVAPMVSGRYPNLGPEVLLRAGVPMVDGVGSEGLAALTDGRRVRLHAGTVLEDAGHDGADGGRVLASGRALDADTVEAELARARQGLATQLETFTHNSAAFLQREQDLLLHGVGVPVPATRIAGRTVVVVADGPEVEAELTLLRPYLREQEPVVVAVGRSVDTVRGIGRRPDVVVVDAAVPDGVPTAAALKAARDVVVRTGRGTSGKELVESLDRLGIRPLRIETDATAEDAALLLADAGDAAVVIGVGMHATLEEFLDRERSGLASTYLTRLKLGARLVDAAAVPFLYSGRVRPHHLLLVMVAGLVALAAAVGVTPVGQGWADQLSETLQGLLP